MPSPRNASALSSFTTICSGVCFENFLMVIHSARPQATRTTQNNPLKTNGPKNPDPSRSGADDPNLLSRTLRSYYNNPVSLLQRFKAISESVGASDGGTAKDKFFAEIDGPLDDRYVGLLTDGSMGIRLLGR